MMSDKTTVTARGRAPQRFEEAAIEFERNKTEEERQSKKLAWRVATVCIALTVISVIGHIAAVLVRREPEPLLLQPMGDGTVQVVRALKNAQDKYDEVTDKYWLGKYVEYRESYDWWTISTQLAAVKLMSSDDEGAKYEAEIRGKTSPLNVLADRGRWTVKVSAVAFVGDLAQVRFVKTLSNPKGEVDPSTPPQAGIATIAYKYQGGLMTDQERQINPYGFKALTYRKDSELVK